VSDNRFRVLPSLDPEKFPKKNALTPIGAYSFGISSICVTASVFLYPSPMSWALFGVSLLTIVITLWAAWYFVLNDADRLQTEDYRIQKEMVARLEQPQGYSEKQLPPRDAKLISDKEGRK